VTYQVNPFAISTDLEDFLVWCDVDPRELTFDQAIEWSLVMEEWGAYLGHSLIPTACLH
jgi:hypothetical protein